MAGWISSVKSPLDYPKLVEKIEFKKGKSILFKETAKLKLHTKGMDYIKAGEAAPGLEIKKEKEDPDSYIKRLLEYIPRDIIALYIAITGIVLASDVMKTWVSWAVIAFCVFITPFEIWFGKSKEERTENPKGIKFRAIVAPIAFFGWAFALGGPFVKYSWYDYSYGTLIIVFITFMIPFVERIIGNYIKKSEAEKA